MGCDGFHPKVPVDLTKETSGELVKFFEKVEPRGKWPQQACTTLFFLTTKNVTSERSIALMPTLVGSLEITGGCEVAAEVSSGLGTPLMVEMVELSRQFGNY